MQLRIALLNASHGNPDTPRNFRRELDADLVEFDVTSGALPDSFAYDAAVVTGSRASVYWDEPWITPLKGWVGEAIDRGMAFLGICYGHQLLADVLGGTVEGMDDYELGYRHVSQYGGTLFDGVDGEFLVFTTRSDAVTDLPDGATLTAENDRGIHGFEAGDVFGVQFHPEYDMGTARRVTEGKRKHLPDERVNRVIDGIDEEAYTAACDAKTLFENFTTYVRDLRANGNEANEAGVQGSELQGESAGAL